MIVNSALRLEPDKEIFIELKQDLKLQILPGLKIWEFGFSGRIFPHPDVMSMGLILRGMIGKEG